MPALEEEANLPDPVRQTLSWQATRSGGPGGQHVNKTSSAVILLVPWDALAEALSAPALDRLRTQNPHRCTESGLQLRVETDRSQLVNRRHALTLLTGLLKQARQAPRVRKKRTGPSLGAKRRRLEEKKKRSERKQDRKRPSW